MNRVKMFGGIVSLVGAMVMLLAGCEPGAPSQQGKLPPDLLTLKAEVEKGKAQIDMVTASLETTLNSVDPKPEFKKFQDALAALKSQAGVVRSRTDAMKAKGKDYFKNWEEQLATISSPDIKKSIEARRDELVKSYEAITAGMVKARDSFDKFMAFHEDLAKVMENDLNSTGLKAIAPKTAPSKDLAKTVKADVDAVLADLNKLAAIYSPGK